MIEEFEPELLLRRRIFLEKRAEVHLLAEANVRWHRLVSATLFRDAAAIAFMAGDINDGRALLRRSGIYFFDAGFVAGLQLSYVAGALDEETNEATGQIGRFGRAFRRRAGSEFQSAEPPLDTIGESQFDDESFRPSQLLRAYQAFAGRISNSDEVSWLLSKIHEVLVVSPTMPVGAARIPLQTYLAIFDQFSRRKTKSSIESRSSKKILDAMVQRREELIAAVRRDRHTGHLCCGQPN